MATQDEKFMDATLDITNIIKETFNDADKEFVMFIGCSGLLESKEANTCINFFGSPNLMGEIFFKICQNDSNFLGVLMSVIANYFEGTENIPLDVQDGFKKFVKELVAMNMKMIYEKETQK